MLEPNLQQSQSRLQRFCSTCRTSIHLRWNLKLPDQPISNANDMLYVLLCSRIVCQFWQPIMSEFSMQLVLLAFILVFGKFTAELSTVVDWGFFVCCAEVVPCIRVVRINYHSLLTVFNNLFVLCGDDAVVLQWLLLERVLLAWLKNFKLDVTQFLVADWLQGRL